MSDVEKICEQNHQRVRWAEEYADAERIENEAKEKKQRDKSMDTYRIYRAATLFSAGSAGIGLAFLCIGLCMMHFSTVVMGALMAVVFFCFCCMFDAQAEKELDHVCGF